MVEMLCHELEMQKDYLKGETISTIYFGGGTPSILESPMLSKIIGAIYKHYKTNAEIEITFESNPDDFSKSKRVPFFTERNPFFKPYY